MEKNSNVHLQENLMYIDTGNRYGIYQLVYTDRLEAGETLDSLLLH